MSAENSRPAGVPDRGAVQSAIREAAQKAQELQRQAEAARASLNEAAAKVQELERQAATAQKAITVYQEQEAVIARALQDAQRNSDELTRTAKTRAEETIAAAKSAADSIAQSARASATETLQKAREAAEAQTHAAERAAAAARASAEEIVNAARAAAHETLEKARESAAAQIRAAERSSAEHLARLRADSDQLVEEADRKVQEIRRTAEQFLTGITARLDAFISDRENVSRGLEALAKNHAESLQILMRLRGEVQSQILPAVQRLVRRLKGQEGGEDLPPSPAEAASPHEAQRPAHPHEPAPAQAASPHEAQRHAHLREPAPPPAPAAPEAPAEEPRESGEPGIRYSGEIVVSPIHSFLQATKFMTALSQIRGVASVKLRTYSGAKATIEVITEGHTVKDIHYKAIEGFPIEVVESTDTHLVLRIGNPAARPVAG